MNIIGMPNPSLESIAARWAAPAQLFVISKIIKVFIIMIIVLAALLVMLIFIGFDDGWIKALLILGMCVASIILALIIMVIVGVEKGNAIAVGRFILDAWAVGLILYNILTGKIKNT